MSEKRFTVDDNGIYDNHEKKCFKFIAYDWIDCDIHECCEKLNEQQSILIKQEQKIKHLREVLTEIYVMSVQESIISEERSENDE